MSKYGSDFLSLAKVGAKAKRKIIKYGVPGIPEFGVFSVNKMPEKNFHYTILYRLNFIPGVMLFIFWLIFVFMHPSKTQNYGYILFLILFVCYCALVLIERAKVPGIIIVNDEGIKAKKWLCNDISFKWNDIELLHFSGKGLFLVSGKVEMYLYAEIVSKDKKKIVIRREINDYKGLIELIELNTGKTFNSCE